ncbi:RadC family protein [uncultured Sphingomonas sp.]|uniref:JAB domain-containing protein n=1 Tax=uncultured Sphingomonas sp. TaxID=158754 RepID=UPI0025FEAC5B|nr:JAB domain-containing protein [uncultured Sphingomonas sp.]
MIRLGAFRRAMLHVLNTEMRSGPVISGSSVLMAYLRADMALSPVECVRVLHLNSRNMLIRDEMIARGTVDAVAIYNREIIARALELGSSALIIAHNHPGGDPSPSSEDVEITKALVTAAGAFDIQVHDHVIVASEGFSSMRQLRLL